MKNYSRQLLAVFSIFLFLLPFSVKGVTTINNPLQANTFEELINALINILYTLAVWIAPVMIIVAGFYFVTAAAGNPDQINTAKKIILWTLIGLVIMIAAKGIIELFQEVF